MYSVCGKKGKTGEKKESKTVTRSRRLQAKGAGDFYPSDN